MDNAESQLAAIARYRDSLRVTISDSPPVRYFYSYAMSSNDDNAWKLR